MKNIFWLMMVCLASGCASTASDSIPIDTSKAYIVVGTYGGPPDWSRRKGGELNYCANPFNVCTQKYQLEDDSETHVFKIEPRATFAISEIWRAGEKTRIKDAMSITPPAPGIYYYGDIMYLDKYGITLEVMMWKLGGGNAHMVLSDNQKRIADDLRSRYPNLLKAFDGKIQGLPM